MEGESMKNVIAYDFGTGGIKASIYRADGSCLASHCATYETHYPKPNWHEQDPEAWWQALVNATRRMLKEWKGNPGSIAAIGISGHSLGVVPLNANGKLLRQYGMIWSDSRPDTQPAEFFKHVSEKNWYMTTGCGFPPALYTVFKIMWLRDNEPDVFKRIHKVLGSKDYINYRLTGVVATDYSYASGSGVWDLVRWRYDAKLIAASGLDASIFPDAVAASEVIGGLSPEAAFALGLPAGVKVVAGGVDNSCMALGARAFRDGDAYNSMGSSSWIAVSGSKPLLDLKSRPYVFAHVVPGQFASAIGVFSTGSSLRWIREQLCRNLDTEAKKRKISIYDLIIERAAGSPMGARGAMFLPTLAGGSSLDPSPNVRGAFAQLELGMTQDDLCRAGLEGISMAQALALRALEALAPLSGEILAVGGGSVSDFWMQMYADMYGKKMIRSQVGQQAAALGAAATAFVGIMEWRDYMPMASIHKITDVRKPIASNRKFYSKRIDLFGKMNRCLCEIGDEVRRAG